MNWLSRHFELSRGGSGHNVRPMEGLRGLAVFLVFLVHYVSLVTPWLPKAGGFLAFTESLHSLGNVGVDLFFVLSGYLIYGSLIARPQPFRRFLTRRVERIYPAFLAVFAAYLLLSFAFPPRRAASPPGRPRPSSIWPRTCCCCRACCPSNP